MVMCGLMQVINPSVRRENDARFLDQAIRGSMESLDEGACEDKDTDVIRPAVGHVR